MTASWLPVHQLDCTGLHGIFTDIDDTLTTGGKLPAAVYVALEQLRDAGFASSVHINAWPLENRSRARWV